MICVVVCLNIFMIYGSGLFGYVYDMCSDLSGYVYMFMICGSGLSGYVYMWW